MQASQHVQDRVYLAVCNFISEQTKTKSYGMEYSSANGIQVLLCEKQNTGLEADATKAKEGETKQEAKERLTKEILALYSCSLASRFRLKSPACVRNKKKCWGPTSPRAFVEGGHQTFQ